jgi:hypothetical protein
MPRLSFLRQCNQWSWLFCQLKWLHPGRGPSPTTEGLDYCYPWQVLQGSSHQKAQGIPWCPCQTDFWFAISSEWLRLSPNQVSKATFHSFETAGAWDPGCALLLVVSLHSKACWAKDSTDSNSFGRSKFVNPKDIESYRHLFEVLLVYKKHTALMLPLCIPPLLTVE